MYCLLQTLGQGGLIMDLLIDLSEQKIKEAICYNFGGICDFLQKEKFDVYERDGVRCYSSYLPYAIHNRVVTTSSNEENIPTIIEDICNYFQSRNRPFMWMTWPGVDMPNNLDEWLVKYGFELVDSMPGMALKLQELSEDKVDIEGFDITEVRTDDDLAIFSEVSRAGFSLTKEIAEGFELMNRILFEQPEYGTLYLARLNGIPVAASSVAYDSGVAGIYAVCTLAEHRGKGIGTAITKQPLLEAKSKGYKLAILHSSNEGINIYKKLGFQQYYEIGMYMKKTDPL